jgi:hypothetical protein
MAEKHDQIMEMVTEEIKRDENVSLPALMEKAQEIDPSVKELSSRQFNARYPLQVKRKLSGAKGGRKPGSRRKKKAQAQAQTQAPRRRARRGAQATGERREELRKVFFEFAREFADAETKTEIVGVLNKVESYSERVEKIFT